MFSIKKISTTFSVMIICCIFLSCQDAATEREVVANLSLKNNCPGIFKADSVDVVMRFNDKDNNPIIDADVIKRVAVNDKEMKVKLTLKKSDKWKIKALSGRYGFPFCSGACNDSVLFCRQTAVFPDFVSIDSVLTIDVSCDCLR